MSFRIHDSVVRGVLDNRAPSCVTGRLWLAGRAAPVQLRLRGNCLRDLAGCKLSFEHICPERLEPSRLSVIQEGVVGSITASRRNRIPAVPREEIPEYYIRRQLIPTVWANVLYVEWFSERNGRVVLESSDFYLHISDHAWTMTSDDERHQCKANASALREYIRRLVDG